MTDKKRPEGFPRPGFDEEEKPEHPIAEPPPGRPGAHPEHPITEPPPTEPEPKH
jgi:hypothetical protein